MADASSITRMTRVLMNARTDAYCERCLAAKARLSAARAHNILMAAPRIRFAIMIAGGGDPTVVEEYGGRLPNTVANSFGTVGGGRGNLAGDPSGIVADASSATVSGGEGNRALGKYSTVGGGWSNVAHGESSTVGGGRANGASGFLSMVVGGISNAAAGALSFAAGNGANANHDGAFVWADSAIPQPENLDAIFPSTAANQFRVRSVGGAEFVSAVDVTSGAVTAGVTLAAGGNSWGTSSDRNLKDNITPVDGHDILRRLSAIDITRWNLKAQDPTIKHLGPMAQDFYAAFGLGENEQYINSADADGVALVSIQALYRMMMALEQKTAALDEKTAALEQKSAELVRIADSVEDLRARLGRFERAAAGAM